jgi:predicted DNA-binding transcriptional regulator YafY
MNRFDRLLGILLALRAGGLVSTTALAARFEVSARTIYRDLDLLSALGVPVYAQRGRGGGVRLMEGYFLPPIMFSPGEATALVLAVALLRSLRAVPFVDELGGAEHKLRAAAPEQLRALVERVERVVGFEAPPEDIFHTDGPTSAAETPLDHDARQTGQAVTTFLSAIIAQRRVALRYRSPYWRDGQERMLETAPLGVFWDRERWYLAGAASDDHAKVRLWRADRVGHISVTAATVPEQPDFDIRALLGRTWLGRAMRDWTAQAPVRIALSERLRARLAHDWYYQHAAYSSLPDGRVLLEYSDDDQPAVFALLRWLGPEAELLEPREWRAAFAAELRGMFATY